MTLPLKSSLKHRRKQILRLLRLNGDQAFEHDRNHVLRFLRLYGDQAPVSKNSDDRKARREKKFQKAVLLLTCSTSESMHLCTAVHFSYHQHVVRRHSNLKLNCGTLYYTVYEFNKQTVRKQFDLFFFCVISHNLCRYTKKECTLIQLEQKGCWEFEKIIYISNYLRN